MTSKQISPWRKRLAIVATGFAGLGAFTLANPSDADAITPAVSIENGNIGEGNNGQKVLVLAAKLSMPAPGPQWIKVQSYVNSGASTADFVPATVTVQFPQNATQMIYGMTINGDILDEASESFGLKVVGHSPGLTIADGLAFAVINDDDAPPVMTINDVSKKEGTGGGTTGFTFTAKLSAPSGLTIKATAAGASGSAHVPEDLTANPATLTFNPGVTSQTYTAHVNADPKVEPNEQFTVELSQPSNTVITDKTGVGTITNDDALVIDPPKDPKPDPQPEPQPQPEPEPGDGGNGGGDSGNGGGTSGGSGGGFSGGGTSGGSFTGGGDTASDTPAGGEGEQALGENPLTEAKPASERFDWMTAAMLTLLGACFLGLILVALGMRRNRREANDA